MKYVFFNDTATTEIYTLSLHDALPICWRRATSPTLANLLLWYALPTRRRGRRSPSCRTPPALRRIWRSWPSRSEEHTSELQSRQYLVCRPLLEKKKTQQPTLYSPTYLH